MGGAEVVRGRDALGEVKWVAEKEIGVDVG